MSDILSKLKSYWYSEGGPKEILSLAIPLALSTSSYTLQLFIDRLFLTWHSQDSIAAAVPAYLVLWTFLGPLYALVSFATTFVAQYHARGEFKQIGNSIIQALIFSLFGGIVFLLLIPFAENIFSCFGHSGNVLKEETIYLQILIFSCLPYLITSSVSSFFSGIGKGWVVLNINCLATIINIILGYGLILGGFNLPKLGIVGAGIAATTAYFITSIVAICLLFKETSKEDIFKIKKRIFWNIDFNLISKYIKFGGPNALMLLIEIFSWTWFDLLLGTVSASALAATNIAMSINNISFMPALGFGNATQSLVGHKIGEKKINIAVKTTYNSLFLVSIYMFVIAILFAVLPDLFLIPYTWGENKNLDFLSHTKILLKFIAFYTLFDAMIVVFAGALRGAGDTKFIMLVTLLLALGTIIIPTYVACKYLNLGLYTVWACASLYVILLGVILYLRFRSNLWQKFEIT